MQTVLTGVKPTGQPHIGNYLGAIKPALSFQSTTHTFLFIADYHSLTAATQPKELNAWVYELAATWIACGLDPEQTVFYRQSDIPENFELYWVLSCLSSKGLMNRAHAYKAKVQENVEAAREDQDHGVNMGLFTYPLLMSSDILLFDADTVPTGEDQLQHIEIARDLAQRMNHHYGPILKVPSPQIRTQMKTVLGLDGRKMSKSYNNTIPLFSEEKKLRSLIMKIKTDSTPPEAPKETKGSLLFDWYQHWATAQEIEALSERYAKGIAWGHVKEELFEVINREIKPLREVYQSVIGDKDKIDQILKRGADKAREVAKQTLLRVRKATGIER